MLVHPEWAIYQADFSVNDDETLSLAMRVHFEVKWSTGIKMSSLFRLVTEGHQEIVKVAIRDLRKHTPRPVVKFMNSLMNLL